MSSYQFFKFSIEVRNSGTYLPRITRPICSSILLQYLNICFQNSLCAESFKLAFHLSAQPWPSITQHNSVSNFGMVEPFSRPIINGRKWRDENCWLFMLSWERVKLKSISTSWKRDGKDKVNFTFTIYSGFYILQRQNSSRFTAGG
jgi:hypothetical protein